MKLKDPGRSERPKRSMSLIYPAKGINVARQTISTNLETVKGKASQLKHCALEKAGKSIQFTGNYISEKPYNQLELPPVSVSCSENHVAK